MKNYKSLAIIPARGGSKRIPKKNIRPFLGKPIIQYSIEAAYNSGCFDEVMVSTDSREIADISLKAGAKVPFLRSAKNSSDTAPVTDAALEVLENYRDKFAKNFEFCCCIFSTSPLISHQRITTALKMLEDGDADVVLPVVEFDFPIQRASIIKHGYVEMIDKKNQFKRSQDLFETYHDAGRFVWARTAPFLKKRTLFVKKVLPMILPRIEVQDIDTEDDWKEAEVKYLIKNNLLTAKKEVAKWKKLNLFLALLSLAWSTASTIA